MTLQDKTAKWYSVFRVDPSEIVEQRKKKWSDFHPEEFCHRCGNRNLQSWFVEGAEWRLAIHPNEERVIDGYPGSDIICPQCFVEAWERTTGVSVTWELRLYPPSDHRTTEEQ